MKTSVSVSTIARVSAGLTVTRLNDRAYLVTVHRGWRTPDMERITFPIRTEEFLSFADSVAKLAEAERAGGDGERTAPTEAVPTVEAAP